MTEKELKENEKIEEKKRKTEEFVELIPFIFLILVLIIGVVAAMLHWKEYAPDFVETFCKAEFLCYERNSKFEGVYFNKFPNWIGWLLIVGLPAKLFLNWLTEKESIHSLTKKIQNDSSNSAAHLGLLVSESWKPEVSLENISTYSYKVYEEVINIRFILEKIQNNAKEINELESLVRRIGSDVESMRTYQEGQSDSLYKIQQYLFINDETMMLNLKLRKEQHEFLNLLVTAIAERLGVQTQTVGEETSET